MRLRVGLVVGALLLVLAPGAAAGSVPPGFFGVVPQGEVGTTDLRRMGDVGLTLRLPVRWYEVEPEAGRYDFTTLDAAIGDAAAAGVRVLPFVYGSPGWVAPVPERPPLASSSQRAAWSAFLIRLVGRYGPRGDFWGGTSSREPIRRWQIWNEPNFLLFWRPRPQPGRYAQLLKISAAAIRGADPGAQILAAGVAPVEAGMLPWVFLRKMYRVPGVRRAFDVAALHPYATTLSGLEYEIRQVRKAMAAGGDGRKPLQLTEIGIASGGTYPNPFSVGPIGQARFLRTAYLRLLANRHRWRIAGIDWFTWRDGTAPDPHCVFCQYAGLFNEAGRAKPAWWTLKRVVADAVR